MSNKLRVFIFLAFLRLTLSPTAHITITPSLSLLDPSAAPAQGHGPSLRSEVQLLEGRWIITQ